MLIDRHVPDYAYLGTVSNAEVSINPQLIFEALCDIKYDKNGTGQFSAPLKSEFTDYALHDIANKLYAKLNGMELN